MPKKVKKTKEEKIVEEYFPANIKDVKQTIEKPEKEPLPNIKQTIEKPYKKPSIKEMEKVEKKEKKELKKSIPKKKNKKYVPPKITLKKGGYELIITEKPQAALKIASALGKPIRKEIKGVSYYELVRNKRKIVVACAAGHLFTLKQRTTSKLPIFELEWVPNYLVLKKDFTKKYYDAILSLAKNAGSITVATDYDIEGEVIGLNIVRFICGQNDAYRMKFSTLTLKELNEAYENKSSSLDWGQAIAGETRHFLDWFYGINLSRAIMDAIKTTGKFRIFSIGRVQGPTLNLVVNRERLIQKFKPKPYWQIYLIVSDGKNRVELKANKNIFEKEELKKFENLRNAKIYIEVEETMQEIPPPHPFDLTTLQTEAYRLFGIKPSRTLQIAQTLYLQGLISYPRTSSQKLPPSIDYKSILKKIAKKYNVEKLVKKETPVQGKKTDPAHPSIYPTGEEANLSSEAKQIYDLIAKRFLSLFCENAVLESRKLKGSILGMDFSVKGAKLKNPSWTKVYPSTIKERDIPSISGECKVVDVKVEEKETSPPKRYSPASLISELEKRNLGTKATRSLIIDTLYERDYIQDTSIKPTPLGIALIETLEKYSSIILDEKLTRDFERAMEDIQKSKKNFQEKKERILEKAKKAIKKIIEDFKKNEKEIGECLLKAREKFQEERREENKLCLCPICKKGYLRITYSRKNKRYFVACDAYPECKTTYSLPPNGVIKKTDKVCEKCGFPLLVRISKGKRPWQFCFNPSCETNRKE